MNELSIFDLAHKNIGLKTIGCYFQMYIDEVS